jgi:hypothetical protein
VLSILPTSLQTHRPKSNLLFLYFQLTIRPANLASSNPTNATSTSAGSSTTTLTAPTTSNQTANSPSRQPPCQPSVQPGHCELSSLLNSLPTHCLANYETNSMSFHPSQPRRHFATVLTCRSGNRPANCFVNPPFFLSPCESLCAPIILRAQTVAHPDSHTAAYF